MRVIRRRHLLIPGATAALVLLLFLNGLTGTFLFAHSKVDPLARADAIVVLGGEHDGRETYGLTLAEQGYAPVVLLSNPYRSKDKVMAKACAPRTDIRVICRAPVPSTTRGEAMMTRELADKYGWDTVIVVSWRYHLPRARRIFEQCFTSPTRHVIMRDVPRQYPFSVAQWQYTYLYQYGGWVKAEILGC
ncbi:YdcF family protein [Mycolicibacterium austroafricanum]|uniref:YdcF family protein n=1 Tax=Mycolicibacterium austroafricanum TaxID=39687 RepID=A0ABT8HHS0_MYCAO|nr:YdcF family protein [Mycolicibacterium austroafricanum]MDN4520281.1 YdcF family protein [Mycolicibacterium austroafricanum]